MSRVFLSYAFRFCRYRLLFYSLLIYSCLPLLPFLFLVVFVVRLALLRRMFFDLFLLGFLVTCGICIVRLCHLVVVYESSFSLIYWAGYCVLLVFSVVSSFSPGGSYLILFGGCFCFILCGNFWSFTGLPGAFFVIYRGSCSCPLNASFSSFVLSTFFLASFGSCQRCCPASRCCFAPGVLSLSLIPCVYGLFKLGFCFFAPLLCWFFSF